MYITCPECGRKVGWYKGVGRNRNVTRYCEHKDNAGKKCPASCQPVRRFYTPPRETGMTLRVHFGQDFADRRVDGPFSLPHHAEFHDVCVVETFLCGEGRGCYYEYRVTGPSPTGRSIERSSEGDVFVFAGPN